MDVLRVNESLFNLDFYVVAETNLNNNLFSAELRFSSFNIYRCDGDYVNCGVTQSGGILICANTKYVSLQIDISKQSTNFELIFAYVLIDNIGIIIVGAYFSTNTEVSAYNSFFKHNLIRFSSL